MSRRLFLLRVSSVAAVSLLSACGGSPPSSAPTASGSSTASSAASSAAATSGRASSSASPAGATGKKRLTIGQSADVSGMDPHIVGGSPDNVVHFNVFDNLISRHADLKLYPSLATEWKTVGDTIWEFKLRSDARFHNGDPLTSRDVKFSAERTLDPASKAAYSQTLNTIDRIETPDDSTVHYITKNPDPLLPGRLATLRAQIIPVEYFKKVGPDGFNQKPVGSGPLKLAEWKKDDYVVLARNDDYWGDKVPVETVTLKPIPEVATRLGALKKGEVQIATRLTPDQWDELSRGQGFHGVGSLLAGLYVLGVNYRSPALGDKLVRQALSAAIDRQSLLKEIYRDQGIVPNSSIPKGSFAYDSSLPPYPFDSNKARQLLKQSSYNNELIVIESAGYVPGDKQMSEAIAGMWKDVGINSKVELIEFAVRAAKKRDKSFKGLWWADPGDLVFDPDGMMWFYLSPGGIYDYGWRDPEFDRAGEDARSTLDQERRLKDYRLMTRIFNESFPWLPILQPNDIYGVANSVEWKPSGNSVPDLRGFNLKLKA